MLVAVVVMAVVVMMFGGGEGVFNVKITLGLSG
jgi:hypothetical protein